MPINMSRQTSYTIIFLLLLNMAYLPALTQYAGGTGNGFSIVAETNINLSLSDSLYNGGNGNGFNTVVSINTNLALTDSLYNGGIGTGFNAIVITSINLYLSDSLYNGGSGRGEIQFSSPNVNLGICGDTIVWNGNQNINWADPGNWDCGSIPAVNSIVIIDAGKPRYPVIGFNTEIKKLDMRQGATVIVLAGRVLTINGQ